MSGRHIERRTGVHVIGHAGGVHRAVDHVGRGVRSGGMVHRVAHLLGVHDRRLIEEGRRRLGNIGQLSASRGRRSVVLARARVRQGRALLLRLTAQFRIVVQLVPLTGHFEEYFRIYAVLFRRLNQNNIYIINMTIRLTLRSN